MDKANAVRCWLCQLSGGRAGVHGSILLAFLYLRADGGAQVAEHLPASLRP
jgi:hypothetical protein